MSWMSRDFVATAAGIGLLFMLGGCSVGMAISGKEGPDLGAFGIGSTRSEVELQLGSPISSVTTPNGTRTHTYEYELGNEPNTLRAIGHGAMDLLTLGIWEVIATPVEASQGAKYRMTIVYGHDDRVVAISQPARITVEKQGKSTDTLNDAPQ